MALNASDMPPEAIRTTAAARPLREPAPPPIDFRSFYSEHLDYVWCNLRRLGVAEACVADATQDVFVVVHRRLREFVPYGSARSWVFGIALRVARDYRRRELRKGGLAPLQEDGVVGAGPSPAESAERSQAVRTLERLLEGLDDDKREVFVLVDVNEVPPIEAARVLGLTVPAVHSRLRGARLQFEAAVERHHRRQR